MIWKRPLTYYMQPYSPVNRLHIAVSSGKPARNKMVTVHIEVRECAAVSIQGMADFHVERVSQLDLPRCVATTNKSERNKTRN